MAAAAISDYGLTEVYTPPEPVADLVLVHGLNGHPYNTWTADNGVFWPRDLLPQYVENVRVLVYGYDANVSVFTDGVGRDNIHNHAENLVARLQANRRLQRAIERPIIFIAHSLGGLVVKRCLIYSRSIDNPSSEHLRSIYVSTFGVLFMGTPQLGSDLAKWGSILQSISHAVLPRKLFDSSSHLVSALVANNETLMNINRLFNEIMPRLRVYFFYEAKPMDLKGTRQFIVDESSAAPDFPGVERMGIERDHSHMCKFDDAASPGFDIVAEAIQRYSWDAPNIIAVRWQQETQVRAFQRQMRQEDIGARPLLAESSEMFLPPSNSRATSPDSRWYGSRVPLHADTSLPTDSGYASMQPFKAQQLPSDDRNSDAMTIYSDNASLQSTQREGFIERFAEMLLLDLVEQVGRSDASASAGENIRDVLADFALKLGSESSTAEFRKAMVFVHKYRGSVQKSFETMLNAGEDDEDEATKNRSGGMALNELMTRWFDRSADDSTMVHDPQDSDLSDDDLDDEDLVPDEVEFYAKMIARSRAYQWLISTLRNRMLLTWDKSEVSDSVASLILSKFPTVKTVRQSVSVPTFEAEIWAEWPLLELLEDQAPSFSGSVSVGQLVTLTGSMSDAQALPCSMYLQQTWPQTGPYFLDVLEQALGNTDLCAQSQRPDGTGLRISFQNAICTVLVNATKDVVVEIAQQLAWMSAVLRHPTFGQGVVYCVPTIHYEGLLEGAGPTRLGRYNVTTAATNTGSSISGSAAKSGKTTGRAPKGKTYQFRFSHETMRKVGLDEQGRCWRKMFGTCNIVKGFPIRKRPQPNLGLEIPLNVMAGLVGTRYVNEYHGKLFVKGFSAMLTPTERFPNVLVWHLSCNDRAEQISYNDSEEALRNVKVEDLDSMRHIVGWCTHVINYPALATASSSIDLSDLPNTQPGCVLDEFSLVFGKPVIQTPSFALLDCQKSLHLSSGTFLHKFTYLIRHYALLWDTTEDRGWLVNCLDTFTHFLSSFIQEYSGPLHARLLHQWNHLRDVVKSLKPIKPVLSTGTIDDFPQSPELSEPADESEAQKTEEVAKQIFSSFTDQLFDAMEKLINYQEQVEHDDARRGSRSLRYLEGWDYNDLLGQHGTKRPRMMIMPTVTYTTIQLLRTLGTVTFFGQGFGDLLLPYQHSRESQSNKQVSGQSTSRQSCPKIDTGKFHIGTTVFDLQKMVRSSTKHNSGFLVLANATILSSHKLTFQQCTCQQTTGKTTRAGHTNPPVQMPWPAKHKHLLSQSLFETSSSGVKDWKTYLKSFINGAIIFGHDEHIGWYIDEGGKPVHGVPPDSSSEIDDQFDDSGLGSSRYDTGSSQGRLSAIPSASDNHKSTSNSSLFPVNQGHSFGNSSIRDGASAVFGNIYNITYNNSSSTSTAQTAYLDASRADSSSPMRFLPTAKSQERASPAKASLQKIASRFQK